MANANNNVRSVRPTVAAAPALAPVKSGKQFVRTQATLRKQTTNCAVYQSRALGGTYIPLVNFPESDEVPNSIIITIEKAG